METDRAVCLCLLTCVYIMCWLSANVVIMFKYGYYIVYYHHYYYHYYCVCLSINNLCIDLT